MNDRKNIVFVAGFAGASLDYALPKVKAHGNLHTIIIAKLTDQKLSAVVRHSDSYVISPTVLEKNAKEEALIESICDFCRLKKADALVSLDEFSIVAVAKASKRLGLRGPGSNVNLARNKIRMRDALVGAGVQCPNYMAVNSEDELQKAVETLRLPIIVKVSEGAGSFCHSVVRDVSDVANVFQEMSMVVKRAYDTQQFGLVDSFGKPEFIAEEIVEASSEGWFDDDRYGDYLSVEGIVCNGMYVPVSITTRLPTAEPFTELGLQTPPPTSLSRQCTEKIIEFASQAVGSLKLENCGTHTEIKLRKNGELMLIETSARLPGASITSLVEIAYGIDMIGLLTQVLLGDTIGITPQDHIYLRPLNAAGAVAILAVNSKGVPWTSNPIFSKTVDFGAVIPASVDARIDWSSPLPEGEPIPSYDNKKGMFNFLGGILLTSAAVSDIVEAQCSVLDHAERLFAINS